MISVARPCVSEEELKEVEKVFKTGWLGMGSWVNDFEQNLKEFLGAKHVIAVNTGTSALHLALECLEIGRRDEVIVPSLTFAASIQAICACGAKPVFCDVYPDTLNINVEDMERRITSMTKAIMPIHYSGLPCQIDKIMEIAGKRNIFVVEDAAHAFGSTYKGKKIGSFGDITCFSFDPIKMITCGEGGAIVTNDDEIAKIAVKKRILGISKDTWSRYKHKRSWFYNVETLGFRYHMSNINAAIGLVQLKKLPLFLERRQKIVKKYDKFLKNVKEIELIKHDYENVSPFNYIIKVKKGREKLMEFLKENDIDSGVHYIPNHLQPFFASYATKLPVTEKVWKQILSLPLYYELKDEEIEKITETIKSFFGK